MNHRFAPAEFPITKQVPDIKKIACGIRCEFPPAGVVLKQVVRFAPDDYQAAVKAVCRLYDQGLLCHACAERLETDIMDLVGTR